MFQVIGSNSEWCSLLTLAELSAGDYELNVDYLFEATVGIHVSQKYYLIFDIEIEM